MKLKDAEKGKIYQIINVPSPSLVNRECIGLVGLVACAYITTNKYKHIFIPLKQYKQFAAYTAIGQNHEAFYECEVLELGSMPTI